MHVYVYVCMHTLIYVCMHVCGLQGMCLYIFYIIQACAHKYVSLYTYIRTNESMYCVYVYMYVRICVYVCI